MNLARSTIKLFIANGGNAIITFVGVAFFANLLLPGELGTFFLFQALIGVLTIPADFGLRGAAEKRISEGTDPGEMLTAALLLKVFPLLVVLGSILLFETYVNDYAGEQIALLLVIAIVSHELSQFGIQIVSAELRVGETAELRLAQKIIWFVVGYLCLQYGIGVVGLMYGLIAGYVVSFVWSMQKRSTAFRRPSLDHARSLTNYSKYNFVSAISGYFYNWMDVLIIGFFLTSSAVGVYEVAWRVTGVVIIGSTAIAHTIFPQISRWDADEGIERVEQLIPWAVTPSLAVSVPAFFGTMLFAQEILRYVFGPEYATAWLVLVVLMAEKVLLAVHVITGRSLKATNHPGLAARAGIIAIACNLLLNVVLIQQYGILGAAVATAVSFGLNTGLCIRYLSRFLTVRVAWREIAWVVISAVGMTLVLVGVELIVAIDSLLRLLGIIGFGATVYAVLLLLSPTLRAKVVQTMQLVKSSGQSGNPIRGDG